MESYFNELSMADKGGFSTQGMRAWLRDIYPPLRRYGMVRCWIQGPDNASIQHFVGNANDRTLSGFLYSFFREPFEGNDEVLGDEFLRHEWKVDGLPCQGLAFASLADTLSLSYPSERWDRASVVILKDEVPVQIRHFSSSVQLAAHEEWILSKRPVVLVPCPLGSGRKTIRLRDDHGKDVLEAFARKLVACPYVEAIVNSLPYNPHARKFINSCSPGGLVEIVLPWTDEGLGLVVKTTGKTERETKAIADILRERYEDPS